MYKGPEAGVVGKRKHGKLKWAGTRGVKETVNEEAGAVGGG